MGILKRVQDRWASPGGYKQLLSMAIPLILSSGALSIQHFVDRMFLTWYSPVAIAASLPAGMVAFTLSCIFMGTAQYANTFVAQYHGAKQFHRIGPSVWQGIYIAIVGGITMILIAPAADWIFAVIGHAPEVQEAESAYFAITCYGSFFPIANSAMTAFFSGRGKNWPVMIINTGATAVNILLNYVLIFGNWGFPEMGIRGAAIATVISGVAAFCTFAITMTWPSLREKYQTIKGWRPDRGLLKRLLRYGFPAGIQFFIDMAGFSFFVLMVGRIGTIELAATNIAFNINTLAFMPMIGFGVAISVLVGQYIGEGDPQMAQRSVYSGAHLTFLYMTIIAVVYVTVPGIFTRAFGARANPGEFAPVGDLVRILLRFVALYTVFDTMNIVFASAIRGAGDTRFVMTMLITLSLTALILPSYLVLAVFERGIYAAWVVVSIYVALLGFSFLLRFLGGKWKSMKVIESIEPEESPVV